MSFNGLKDIPPSERTFSFWFITGAGTGLISMAPGTWGSLLGLILGVLLIEFSQADMIELLAWTAGLSILSIKMIGLYIYRLREQDAPEIVIDEIAGQWIALLPLVGGASVQAYLTAFLLFRFFDILKPWPINIIDRNVKGALGVMADDWLAGLWAAAILYGLILWQPGIWAG